jgi:pyruvate dehydrogenase E1 component beta subunit
MFTENFRLDFISLKSVSVRSALNEAIATEMRNDEDVFLIGEEVGAYNGAYKVSKGLLNEFGERRVIDTPISEYGFSGIGVGAAFSGLRPIVEFMTFNFAMQAVDHIINSAAKTKFMSGGQINCPIVFRGPNGAPGSVAAQHSQCFASWYAHCPGLRVVSPHDSFESYSLLRAAIRTNDPVVFLEHEILYGKTFDMPENYQNLGIRLNKARVIRAGTDITLVAFSISVERIIAAAQILESEFSIKAELINLISLRPIDKETIVQSVMKTGRIISVEEGWPVCGIGSEICSIVAEEAFDYLDSPPCRVCSMDVPSPYSPVLEESVLPGVNKIVEAARMLCCV